MQITEYTFNQSADSQTRNEVMSVTSESDTLDAMIDQWVLKRAGCLSIGIALDDDDNHLPDMIAIGLDDRAGNEVCCVTIKRALLKASYHEIPAFDTYLTCRVTDSDARELNDAAWDKWLAAIGMSDSAALMAHIGPRSAAIPYLMSFVLSAGGIVEISTTDRKYFNDEEMLEELAKENLTMSDFFQMRAAYSDPKLPWRGSQLIMDAVYFERHSDSDSSKGVTGMVSSAAFSEVAHLPCTLKPH